MGNKDDIIYAIEPDGSAQIWGIQPNNKGQVIVPEFIYDKGYKYPVSFINFGLNGEEPMVAEELYLPKSIKDFIVDNIFLKEIHFFGDIEELSGMLDGCISLKKVVVHGTVKQIGYGAFRDCSSIKEIIIERGNSLEIQCSAFQNCSSLECVSVGGKPIKLKFCPNTFCLSAFCGCVNYKFFEGDVLLEDGLLLSTDRRVLYTIVGRHDDDGCYKIPSTICDMLHGLSYKNLRKIDFSECKIKGIDADAFSKCTSLEEVILPSNEVEIGDRAFLDCINLRYVGNFNNIIKLGIAAFMHTGIKKCYLSSGISEIPQSVFFGCRNLEVVEIPLSVKTIANNVFDDCSNIKTVKISRGFKESLEILFKDAKEVEYSFFRYTSNAFYRHSGAYTHGDLNCPYCGSSNRRTYIDGTAECNSCGGEYRYW